jgi:hypothetical protein
VNGKEFKAIRLKLRMTKFKFGRMLGFNSARNSVVVNIHRMENNRKPVPPYIARLAWLIDTSRDGTTPRDSNRLPRWPDWPHYVVETDQLELEENGKAQPGARRRDS